MIRYRSWWWWVCCCVPHRLVCPRAARPRPQLSSSQAVGPALRHGELRGIVQDEQGQPIAGAVVSASARRRYCRLRRGRPIHVPQPARRSLSRSRASAAIPPGARASRAGRARREERHDDCLDASCRRDVRTDGARRFGWWRRGASDAQPARAEHGHDEVAGDCGHLKRSVLKDAGEAIAQTVVTRRCSAIRCPV